MHTGLVLSVEVCSPTLTDSSDSGLGRLPTINLEIQIQVQAPDLFFSHFIAPIPSQVLAELRTYIHRRYPACQSDELQKWKIKPGAVRKSFSANVSHMVHPMSHMS